MNRIPLLLIPALFAILAALPSSIQATEPYGQSDLSKFSDDQLLACFNDWKICGTGEGPAEGWPISDELARRGNSVVYKLPHSQTSPAR
jgi:hypothetical protein